MAGLGSDCCDYIGLADDHVIPLDGVLAQLLASLLLIQVLNSMLLLLLLRLNNTGSDYLRVISSFLH